ncbi:hypothetical protein N8513_01035 [bacterium]|nr:hypothetical protein [Akkermansiaceae bacterium]MDA7514561.1 hypothetical protein [bacterium]MDA8960218.1 hypothetical protein [Akkermansiaceae bacterium]MDB4258524.1 hypothetical protein [Akkermansiaceae bacterium]MDB4268258.1 hypothetical protein [Akkermansiaceae bacterium]
MKAKNRVVVVGGFHEIVELAEELGFEVTGIVDLKKPDCEVCARIPYLGDDEWLCTQGVSLGIRSVIVSPDLPQVRESLSECYLAAGFELATVCHPPVSPSSHLSPGVVVQRLAHISSGCRLATGVRVNIRALVMHDVQIGPFTTIAPAAVLLGRVSLGRRVYVGANATILPGLEIGDDAIIGAGAVVTKNVGKGETVVGVPARNI